MPVTPTIIWNGTPGEKRTNDTPWVEYQFIASLLNTCGECLQYHMAVKRGPWAIPLHWGCNCRQVVIKPGGEAPHAYVDFRDILDNMPQSQKRAAIGASAYKLLSAGKIQWKDIVTPSRVRSLREVVSLKKFSVKDLTGVGIRPFIAQQAHAAVNTPAHVLQAQKTAQLVANAAKAGLSQNQLANQLAKGLAAKVSIAPGPASYAPTYGPAWSGGQVAPHVIGSASHRAELITLLAAPRLIAPPEPAVAAAGLIESIPEEVRPEKLGLMAVDPNGRNEEIDNFLESHPGVKPTELTITKVLRDKVMEHVQNWIRSGSDQDMAKLRAILGADVLPPPIVQFYKSGTVGIPDGFHRLAAYVLTRQTKIMAYVLGKP